MNTSKKRAFDFDVSAWPALPAMKGIFVTGTDTGVGKTLVAGAIAGQLAYQGKSVEVFKPVATGCRRTREGLVSEDAEFLAACADSRMPLTDISPLRFGPALAPNVAARRGKQPIDLEAIFVAYRRLAGAADVVIVEGIGGLMCPISDDFWVIHLAKMMNLPLVIVAHANLGTINHTLLTIHAARSARLKIAGVVINRYRVDLETVGDANSHDAPRQPSGFVEPGLPAVSSPLDVEPRAKKDDDIAILTNPQQIAERGNVEILAIVPEEPSNSVANATIGPDTQFAISQGPWTKIISNK